MTAPTARVTPTPMLDRLRTLRPSTRPGVFMMPSWYATPFVESLLFVLSALEHHGFSYVAHKGLLLGAVRLAGVLPWDDDSDVFLLDADPETLETRLGDVFRSHGFVLRFERRACYYSAFPRLLLPFHMGGLTELGFLTRTVEADGVHFDAHEPARHLREHELVPVRRIPFYGTYVLGPSQAEIVLGRAYGRLGSAETMSRFGAPALHPEADTFWRQARPPAGPLDWPRISDRFMVRKRRTSFHVRQLACSAWYLANRGYWMGVDALRTLAGG